MDYSFFIFIISKSIKLLQFIQGWILRYCSSTDPNNPTLRERGKIVAKDIIKKIPQHPWEGSHSLFLGYLHFLKHYLQLEIFVHAILWTMQFILYRTNWRMKYSTIFLACSMLIDVWPSFFFLSLSFRIKRKRILLNFKIIKIRLLFFLKFKS